MSDLPELRNGRLVKHDPNGKYHRGGIDQKTSNLIQALVVGIDTEIEDNVVGTIPANVPLPLEMAARAIGIRISRAQRLLKEPAFMNAFKSAVETYRKTLEPGSIAMALSIRDDPTCTPKERLKAAEFLYGPKAAPGVTVNNTLMQNNSAHPVGYVIRPAGYVIDLSDYSDEEKAVVEALRAQKALSAKQSEGKIIDIESGTTPETWPASREAAQPRPSRQ